MRTQVWLVGSLLALGCSSSEATDGGAAPVECDPPGFANDPSELGAVQVSATLLDADGAPAADVDTQLCGVNLCIYGGSNASGNVVMAAVDPLVQPAFKYGDGFDYAELAVRVTSEGERPLGDLVVIRLPDYADGAVFPKSSGQVTNGDVTLRLAAGTVIGFDNLTYLNEADRTFRTAPIPVAASTQALPEEFGFELAYGVAPINTHFCPAAGLSVPNSLDWAAGTEVEVFVQGLETGTVLQGPDWAPYGSWTQVATAVVSSNGASIETTDGGIPILSSIALRRK